MRTLAITQNLTLDGRVEMLGDWFDAQGQGEMDELEEELLHAVHVVVDPVLPSRGSRQ